MEASQRSEAKAFVLHIYGAYHGAGPEYLGRDATNVFSSRMLALLERDRALTPEGYVGALDGDPICDCQDFDISRVEATVRQIGPGRAMATVRFVNTGTPETVRLDLVLVRARWRIDNIHNRSTPNLAVFLQEHAGGR